jgi:glycosyl transferase, family 25
MSKINQLFDKVYVLTIERNRDRHEAVNKHLNDTEFEFWYGIDIPQMFPDIEHVIQIPDTFFLNNKIDKKHVSAWTKGQLGAYLSIRNMIETVSTNHKCALMFEDDFVPVRLDWMEKVNAAIKDLPEDWDILLLGYFYYGKAYKLAYNRKLRFIPVLLNSLRKRLLGKNVVKKLPKKISTNLDLAGTSLGGHAYCISKKGAEKLMSYMTPMKESGDVLISKLIQNDLINAYAVYPCLFDQNRVFKSKTEVVN